MYRRIITKYQPDKSYLPSILIILVCTSLLALLQPDESPQLGRNVTSMASRLRLNELSGSYAYDPETRVRRLPQAIIIGARKCGTRALLRFLEVNPTVRSASKEIHFFDRDDNYQKGLDWYRRQMPETDAGQITIEKSPAYFVTKGVPSRIKTMNPGIKLVVILRDPVTRLISDYSQLIANKIETQPGRNRSEEGISGVDDEKVKSNVWRSAELEFKQHILTPAGRIDERRRLIRTGMYSTHLERWLALFSRSQFHFVDGEKLVTHPHIELQKLESFLGIRSTIRPEHFIFIAEKGFYCISGTNVTASRHNVEVNETLKKPICLSKSKGRRHIAVDGDLRNKLIDFYAPYNEYLASLIGINFN